MRIRDKITTAACLSAEGIEWTTLRTKQGKTERTEQQVILFPEEETQEGVTLETVKLPDSLSGKLEGDITASIRTSELIMRTIEIPSTNPEEIASMINFQIDKIVPLPMDQMAVSHEILTETENGTLVLMAAAKRSCIDAVGETFKKQNIHIHSIDVRILGWLNLLREARHIEESGMQILIVDDNIDFSIAILKDGHPLSVHSLERAIDTEEKLGKVLAEEIDYTLAALGAEHDLPSLNAIEYWGMKELETETATELRKAIGLSVNQKILTELPPLSQGIAQRSLSQQHRIELIPQEWVEHEKSKKLKKQITYSASIIGGIWLVALIGLLFVFNIQSKAYNKLADEERTEAAKARIARQNKTKLEKLEAKENWEDCALEAFREAVECLPEPKGSIILSQLSYEKSKNEVSIRGTANTGEIVNNYFDALSKSELFTKVENPNNSTDRRTRTVQYSATLLLPVKEEL